MRLLIPDLTPGQNYKIQLRSNDGQAVSEWSPLIDLNTTSDSLAPAPASSLSWVVEGTSFIATWVAPTTNSDGTALKDFQDYQITLYSSVLPAEKVVYYTAATRFDFPYEVNSSAFTAPRAAVTIEVKARDTSGNLSTLVTATATNAAPSNVTGLVVTGGQGLINSVWTNITDEDLKYYEVYASLTNGFTPGPANLKGVTAGTSYVFDAAAGATWYVKVRAVDIFNTGSAIYASGNATARSITDGLAPTTSPVATVIGGIGSLYVRWTGVTNADPVTYVVHIGTTFAFTPSSSTLIGETKSNFITVRSLPGPIPLPGDIDTRSLQYDTPYFAKVIAKDDDGAAAAASSVNSDMLVRVTGPDVAAETITGNNIVGGSFTGREFAGETFIGNKFTSRAGGTGQGVEFGVDGFGVYRANNTKKFYVPINDDESPFIDGEFVARGLTVTGGSSFQSTANEITADASMTLMRGIVAPSAIPQVAVTWDSVRPDTASLTAANKTNNDPQWGLGGPFDLVPSQVTHIYWDTCWCIVQTRTNGSRTWFFNPDGTPKNRYGGVTGYFTDLKDWEVWSTTVMTTGSNPGVYAMFRFLPDNNWYVSGPGALGLNKYTRLNSTGQPAIGNNGINFFIAEVVSSSLKVNYHSMTPWSGGAIPNLPAASTLYTSANASYATSLCSIEFSTTGTGGFDLTGGAPVNHRYATSERGVNYSARTIYQQGASSSTTTNLWPGAFGGTPGGWSAPEVAAESFESPTANRRGMAWDGANFWTYGGDGYLYKHEGATTQFDPNSASSAYKSGLWWAQISFYDDYVVAGSLTHETKPGGFKSFTMKRRAKMRFTPPAIPDNGAPDDPKKVRLYMARKATQPTNAEMWLQDTTAVVVDRTVLATTGSNPLTVGTFPNTNPAIIKNDDSSLVISGDGSIIANLLTAANLKVGSLGTTIKQIRSGVFNAATVGTSPNNGQAVVTHGGTTAPTYFIATAILAQSLRVQAIANTATTTVVQVYAFGSATAITTPTVANFYWTAIWI